MTPPPQVTWPPPPPPPPPLHPPPPLPLLYSPFSFDGVFSMCRPINAIFRTRSTPFPALNAQLSLSYLRVDLRVDLSGHLPSCLPHCFQVHRRRRRLRPRNRPPHPLIPDPLAIDSLPRSSPPTLRNTKKTLKKCSIFDHIQSNPNQLIRKTSKYENDFFLKVILCILTQSQVSM